MFIDHEHTAQRYRDELWFPGLLDRDYYQAWKDRGALSTEDRCRARKGNAPRTLACLRNFAIGVLRLHKAPNIKAALRDLAARPATILAMLRL
jgi:trimethylamine:corrinoid methyltransferase-like protein